jgi:hypothetical protein
MAPVATVTSLFCGVVSDHCAYPESVARQAHPAQGGLSLPGPLLRPAPWGWAGPPRPTMAREGGRPRVAGAADIRMPGKAAVDRLPQKAEQLMPDVGPAPALRQPMVRPSTSSSS